MEMNTEAKWYVLHTNPGYENVAQENLKRVIEKNNLSNRIFDIVIPTEDVVEEKNGKKVIVTRKLMPTYILVKMIYGDDIWHAITRTRGITSFVGPNARPLELTEEEIVKMRLEKTEVDITLKIGDQVEILAGALNGQIGVVSSIDKDNLTAKISVEMFGRENQVDVNLDEVRKIM
ncbi:MAG: transcription termination/antitermination protein NusG [Christensenellales bacterium]